MIHLLLFLALFQPPPAASHLKQGLLALNRGDLAAAQTELEQASQQEPNNVYVWTSLAQTFLRLGQKDKASAAAARAEPLSGSNPVASHALALYYSEAGEFAQAAPQETVYARSGKGGTEAWSRAGLFYLRAQDFTNAASTAEAGLAAYPRDPQLMLTFGVARYGQRRFTEAIETFLAVIQLKPQLEQPYIFLGKMLDQAGDHLLEIVADDRTWVGRDPQNAKAKLMLAEALLATDAKDQQAESLLRASAALDPNDWESHYQLGIVLEGKHDYAGAATELERSVALNPKEPTPHYHLARVYTRLGKNEQAQAERELHQRLTGVPSR